MRKPCNCEYKEVCTLPKWIKECSKGSKEIVKRELKQMKEEE